MTRELALSIALVFWLTVALFTILAVEYGSLRALVGIGAVYLGAVIGGGPWLLAHWWLDKRRRK